MININFINSYATLERRFCFLFSKLDFCPANLDAVSDEHADVNIVTINKHIRQLKLIKA